MPPSTQSDHVVDSKDSGAPLAELNTISNTGSRVAVQIKSSLSLVENSTMNGLSLQRKTLVDDELLSETFFT
jgi:hypothetical protein